MLQQQEEEQSQSVSLQDCLKLLKGERDEQLLAGLLLVTKFCKSDDLVSLRAIYDAVGPHFLDRLLRTGINSYFFLSTILHFFFLCLNIVFFLFKKRAG